MKIIYARMPGYNWSVPSDAVARELEKLGHKLTLVSSLDYIPPDNYDFVWSPYESVTMLGDAIKQKLDIPHMAHVEWFPPWRCIDTCNPDEYGVKKADQKEFAATKQHLIKVAQAYKNADVHTLSMQGGRKYISEFCNMDDDFYIRYPSIDVESISMAKQMFSPKQIPFSIITVARAVDNKRYDLIMKVIDKIKRPITWIIVGDGPVLHTIAEKYKDSKQVKLILAGPSWGWQRLYLMSSSVVALNCWSGMPPIEAALLGAHPFILVPPDMKELTTNPVRDELFNKTIPQSNDSAELAQQINNYLDAPSSCQEIVNSFFNHNMGVTPASTNAANLILTMQKWGA